MLTVVALTKYVAACAIAGPQVAMALPWCLSRQPGWTPPSAAAP